MNLLGGNYRRISLSSYLDTVVHSSLVNLLASVTFCALEFFFFFYLGIFTCDTPQHRFAVFAVDQPLRFFCYFKISNIYICTMRSLGSTTQD